MCRHSRWARHLRWAAALATAAVIVKGTKIGPVVLVVSDRHGWGVHLGDSLALVPVALAAALEARTTR